MIDAHLHLWDPGRLRYDWLAHVPAIAHAHGPAAWASAGVEIKQAVFVQADCAPAQALDEVDWVAGLNAPGLDIAAIVAFAPLEIGRAVADPIAALRLRPLVRGVRRSVQNEAAGFIVAPDHLDGLCVAAQAGLSLDICARSQQLPELLHALTHVFERVPDARVVLDHLGKPDIAAHKGDIQAAGWADSLRSLAALPNLTAKISGLVTQDDWADWRPETLTPYIDHAIAVFGPHRLMFGGDWPVVDLAGGYSRWLAMFDAAIAGLDAEDQAQIREATARRTYRLAQT